MDMGREVSMRMYVYQERTGETAVYPEAGKGSEAAREYVVLGLANEAGELAGARKKKLRGDYTEQEEREKIVKELGDVLYYAARVAEEYGLFLDVIAEHNLAKLKDRKLRGVLKGSGDDR
jgi:NTP pyrophosphatase (non-canonical NTP hydrolase)